MTLGGPRQRHAADQVRPGRLRIRTRPDHNDQFGRKGQNCDVRFVPISDINVLLFFLINAKNIIHDVLQNYDQDNSNFYKESRKVVKNPSGTTSMPGLFVVGFARYRVYSWKCYQFVCVYFLSFWNKERTSL